MRYVLFSLLLFSMSGTSAGRTHSIDLEDRTRRAAPQEESQLVKHLPMDPECGKTRGCFHDCKSGKCSFIVTWKSKEQVINFHMKKIEPMNSERWMAIGFSEDRLMGEDSVTECVITSGYVMVYSSYNEGRTNQRKEHGKVGISNAAGSYVNGVLECSFDHVKKDKKFEWLKNLNDDFYLMYADGDAVDGNLQPHSYEVLPPVSAVKVDLQGFKSVGGEGPKFPLVLAHGSLMIVSWVLMTGIGVAAARYGKPLLPKTHFFGLKIWFQIHRGTMMTTLCLTILSALLIIVESKGYSKIPYIPGKLHHQLHPPLGIIVCVLTMVNPTMALFRPGPESVGRTVFNWAHWGVGVFTSFLAVVTMFIGLDLTKAGPAYSSIITLLVYCVYLVLFLIAMETLPAFLKMLAVKQTKFHMSTTLNLRRRSKGYDLNPPLPSTPEPQPAPVVNQPPPTVEQENRLKSIMLFVHYIITAIMAFTMIILLVSYPH